MDVSDKELLENQLKRIVTRMFKDYLVLLEDVRQDHLAVLSSISSQFPSEFLDKLNYLDLPKYSRLRKKVLDSGNDALREICSILEDFTINR